MTTTGWIILIIVILVLVGLGVFLMRKQKERNLEQHRERAAELRADADSRRDTLHHTEHQARQAQLQAERARVEAERAQTRADEARQGHLQEAAAQEDQVREADRLDPDVDHTSDDYQPETGYESRGVDSGYTPETRSTDTEPGTGTTRSTDV